MKQGRFLWVIGLLGLGVCGPAWATDTGLREYLQIARQFEAQIDQEEAAGDMPRLADPAVATQLGALADNHRFLDGRVFKTEEMETLTDVCGVTSRISTRYLMHGLKARLSAGQSQDEQVKVVRAVMEENGWRFEPEFALIQPFYVRCSARMVSLLGEVFKTFKPEDMTEVRIAGIHQMRTGYQGAILNALLTVQGATDRYKTDFPARMLQVQAETVNAFAPILTLAQRDLVIYHAKRVDLDALPHYRSDVERIVRAMEDRRCEDLCQY